AEQDGGRECAVVESECLRRHAEGGGGGGWLAPSHSVRYSRRADRGKVCCFVWKIVPATVPGVRGGASYSVPHRFCDRAQHRPFLGPENVLALLTDAILPGLVRGLPPGKCLG